MLCPARAGAGGSGLPAAPGSGPVRADATAGPRPARRRTGPGTGLPGHGERSER